MSIPFLFVPTFRALDSGGDPLAGGLLYTYAANSLTPQTTWSDAGGTVPNTNPVVLDSTGSATVRLGSAAYKFVLTDKDGGSQWTQDFYQASYLAQADIGALLNPQTAAEVSAGVTPVNYAYPEGWLQRYGSVNDGTGNNTSAIQAAINVCQKTGQSIQGLPGVYRFTQPLTITSSLTISPPTIAGPRVFAPIGGGGATYGGIEFLFDPASNPSNHLAQTSFALAIVTGTVGSEGFARVRVNGLGISWTQPNAGGLYVVGAVDVGVQDCWFTGGLTNYTAGTAAGLCIYCQDAIISHFQRNTFRYAGYGIVAENYWNENEVSRNDFDRMAVAGVVIRGKAGSSARSTIRSNNFFGDANPGIQYGVYVSGVANGVTIDENTFEVVTRGPIVASDIDLLDSSNNGTPADIHVSGNVFIATNGAGAAAAIQLLCAGSTVWGNSLLTPTSFVSALVNVSASASNVSIWGNDTAGKPLVNGDPTKCVILDDVLFRKMPLDSSESTKSAWTTDNDGSVWWNETAKALRVWISGGAGAGIASLQPVGSATSSSGTTPSAIGLSVLKLNNGSATSITNLTGGFEGQLVTLFAQNGNSTIVNGTFVLSGSANFAMSTNATLTVVNIAGGWYEIGRKA